MKFVPIDKNLGTSFLWNFGNIYVTTGNTSTEASPTYNYYPYKGRFNVSLTMKPFCEDSKTLTYTRVVDVSQLVQTDVVDITDAEEARVYPNPATDYVEVKLKNSDPTAILQIISTAGSVVHQEPVSGELMRVELTNLQPGFYVVKIVSKSNRIEPMKFMKQK